MTIQSINKEYCCSSFPDILEVPKLNISQTALRRQSRYDPIFLLCLPGGSLPVSWNELVFWHDVVKNTKDATECGLEKDPKSGSYVRRNKTEDDCLEALVRTKRYAKSTCRDVVMLLTREDMCVEDRIDLMKRVQSFLDSENETAKFVFGEDWQIELNKGSTRETAQGHTSYKNPADTGSFKFIAFPDL
jgi:hypothetical protein